MRSCLLVSTLLLLSSALTLGQDSPPSVDKPVVSVPLFTNTTCPIMGKPISSKLFVDTRMGRIYVCCKSCNRKILQNLDAAYKTAFPTTKKVQNTTCPVSGKKIAADAHQVVVQGHEIALCCKECAGTAQETSPVVLAKAIEPKLVDIGNKVCPITSKPVEKGTFCVIGSSLVRLSSPECVEAVKKAPEPSLARAKEIASKEAKHAADAKP